MMAKYIRRSQQQKVSYGGQRKNWQRYCWETKDVCCGQMNKRKASAHGTVCVIHRCFVVFGLIVNIKYIMYIKIKYRCLRHSAHGIRKMKRYIGKVYRNRCIRRPRMRKQEDLTSGESNHLSRIRQSPLNIEICCSEIRTIYNRTYYICRNCHVMG